MNDLVVVAIVIGLVVSGYYLIHTMTVTRDVLRFRVAIVVSIVLTFALMIAVSMERSGVQARQAHAVGRDAGRGGRAA